MTELIIGLVAALTGVLSAVAGLGGGIILLAVLAQFFVPTTAIPIQGGVQLVSNLSRSTMLRNDIHWPSVWRTAILMLPASLLGVAVSTAVPERATRALLACFLLAVTWRPQWFRWRGGAGLTPGTLHVVGAVSGFLNTTVGASGPFTSQFFRAVTASHVAFVATAAASQVFAHISKLLAFGFAGFDPREHIGVVVAGALGTLVGTRLGGRLLHRASERQLTVLFNVVLTALACRLLATAFL